MANLFLFDTGNGPEAMPKGPSNGYGYAQNPSPGYMELSEQLVLNTRNARGELVSQRIGKRLRKFDSLNWPYLSREQVTWLKKKVANFEVFVTYYDSEEGRVVRRDFYFGDMSATPCEWDRNGVDDGSGHKIMVPTFYKDVKVNIIDMGLGVGVRKPVKEAFT